MSRTNLTEAVSVGSHYAWRVVVVLREWLQENTPELMESTTEWMVHRDARQMTWLPVKSEFQISPEYFFTLSISQIVLRHPIFSFTNSSNPKCPGSESWRMQMQSLCCQWETECSWLKEPKPERPDECYSHPIRVPWEAQQNLVALAPDSCKFLRNASESERYREMGGVAEKGESND